MASNKNLSAILTEWLSKCFPDLVPSSKSPPEVHQIGQCLLKIDSEAFAINGIVSSDNRRIKASNAKKVLQSLSEFYKDRLLIDLEKWPSMPDAAKVGDGNVEDLGRLLQLVLVSAVNCQDKKHFIDGIVEMEESVQTVIMEAIQELMILANAPPEGQLTGGDLPDMSPTDLRKLIDDYSDASKEREVLKQKVHDLENEISVLKDEKINISTEYEQLQARMTPSSNNSHHGDASGQNQELKRKIEQFQDDIYKLENQRDDLQMKLDISEKQIEESKTKELELQKSADQAIKWKDEVDILRETAEKAVKMEATLDSYKKKLEDMSDLRRQVKLLEERNTEFMQRNMDLEEDVKKTGNWRPQVEAYKKQITELHAKLDAESKKTDKFEFETKKLIEKVESLSVERDRLQSEKEDLKLKNSELVDEIKFGQTDGQKGGGFGGGVDGEPDSGTLEMIPPAIKERLLRLQHENKRLKENGGGGGHHAAGSAVLGGSQDAGVLQSMIETMKDREKELEDSNRKANQRILELESKVEELGSNQGNHGAPARIPGSREELELKLSEAQRKISSLSESLTKKDLECAGMEERYKKYIEKAKSVIRTMDPKQSANVAGGGNSANNVEVSVLRSQISEKDRLIENMEHETEKARAVREMEERLISSAFYNLTMQMNRNAVENRLSNNQGGHPHPQQQHHGQSFLARQRQIQPVTGVSGGGQSTGQQRRGNQSQGSPRGGPSGDYMDYN